MASEFRPVLRMVESGGPLFVVSLGGETTAMMHMVGDAIDKEMAKKLVEQEVELDRLRKAKYELDVKIMEYEKQVKSDTKIIEMQTNTIKKLRAALLTTPDGSVVSP